MKTYEIRESRVLARCNKEDFQHIEEAKKGALMMAMYLVETQGRYKALADAERLVNGSFEEILGEVGRERFKKCETQEDFDKLLDVIDVHSFEFHSFMGTCHMREILQEYKAYAAVCFSGKRARK